jgi:hypothetical protein
VPIPGRTTAIFKAWDSPAVKAYHIFATPSFFLVNAKGFLEKEFISVEQI